jgi:hypothetical protein
MSRQPMRDLRRRQRRQTKVRDLRKHLTQTTDPRERRRIIAKIRKVAPTAPVPEK